MVGSRALICATMGCRRLTARSLLVPKTFAMTEFNKTGVLRARLRRKYSEPLVYAMFGRDGNGIAGGLLGESQDKSVLRRTRRVISSPWGVPLVKDLRADRMLWTLAAAVGQSCWRMVSRRPCSPHSRARGFT